MEKSTPQLSIKPLVIIVALFIVLATFIRFQLTTISPLDETADENVFSAGRAYLMLQELTKEQVPHFVDSPQDQLVAERIISQLRNMGYQEEIQEKQICRDSSRGLARCAKIKNIIVHIAGTHPGNGILLSAHYDSVPAGPGGSDAGAAVGTLLETARLLKDQPRPKNSIVLLFNEGEEFGLFGATLFMDEHPLAKDLQLALNVEARGSTGQSVMFETGEDSGWLVKHYAETTPAPLSSSLFYEVYKILPNDTDLTIFKRHGLQGLNFAHADREPHYHTPLDNLENLDKGSLQHHGDNVWGVLKSIKDKDLTQVEKGNLIYTDVLGLFVIHWSESLSLWLAWSLLAVLVIVCLLNRHSGNFEIKQIFKTLGGFLLILIAAGLSAYLLQKLVQLLSGGQSPWRSNLLPMQLALWSVVALVALFVGKWTNKNVTPANGLTGLASLWAILGVVTSIYMPGISFLFIIPVSIALISLLLMSRLNTNQQVIMACVSAFVAAVMFLPVAYVLEIMVSYRMAIAIAVMLAFVATTFLPLLAITPQSKKGFNSLGAVLGVVCIVGVSWTSFQPLFTAWMPQALNVTYLQDESNKAYVLAGTGRSQLPDALVQQMQEPQLSSKIPWSNREQYYSNTKTHNLKSVETQILENKQVEEGRQVTIQLVTGSENLVDVALYIPVDAGLESIESYGQTIQYDGEATVYRDLYEYRCRGVSCAMNKLTLNFSNNEKTQVIVAKLSAGLPQNVQEIAAYRGDAAVQRQQGDQSIVVSKVEL